jgi:hypothetical protein
MSADAKATARRESRLRQENEVGSGAMGYVPPAPVEEVQLKPSIARFILPPKAEDVLVQLLLSLPSPLQCQLQFVSSCRKKRKKRILSQDYPRRKGRKS